MPFTLLKPTGIDLSQTFAFTGSVTGAGGGKIGQVLQVTDNTERVTTSTSFGLNSSTLTLNITPTATSSKILVMVNVLFVKESSNEVYVTIFKDSTNLGDGNNGLAYLFHSETNPYTFAELDSPNTTSQTNYQIQFRSNDGSNAKLNYGNAFGRLTLMEVLA